MSYTAFRGADCDFYFRYFLQKVVEIITTICYNSDEEER